MDRFWIVNDTIKMVDKRGGSNVYCLTEWFTIGDETVRNGKHTSLYPMAMTALMAAVMAVVAPFALPMGPIPVSLCSLIVCLAAYMLGWKRAMMATLVYLLLGAAGMPVFSGFTGGIGMLLGPTGGYLIGYLLLAMGTGWTVGAGPMMRLVGMVLSTAALYGLGTVWYCIQSGTAMMAAIPVCVFPFLPGDAVKIAVVWTMGPAIRRRLKQAGLLCNE